MTAAKVGTLQQAQSMVRDFHRVMIGTAVTPESPVAPEDYNGDLRCALIEEETAEFKTAWAARNRLQMIDALCDLLYVTLGAAVEMGVDLSQFFEEVHAANMTKVGGVIREDGKQLKPEGWRPPDLERVYLELYGAPRTPK